MQLQRVAEACLSLRVVLHSALSLPMPLAEYTFTKTYCEYAVPSTHICTLIMVIIAVVIRVITRAITIIMKILIISIRTIIIAMLTTMPIIMILATTEDDNNSNGIYAEDNADHTDDN